jgi:hypothetical protein
MEAVGWPPARVAVGRYGERVTGSGHGAWPAVPGRHARGMKRIDAVSATATSADGLVEATAGAFGELRELRLDPCHARVQDAAMLAEKIRDTVRAAASVAALAAYEMIADDLPPGTAPDQADLLFGPALHALDQPAGRW